MSIQGLSETCVPEALKIQNAGSERGLSFRIANLHRSRKHYEPFVRFDLNRMRIR